MNPRRSWLILPAHDAQAAARFKQSGADVAVLDLEYSVAPKHKDRARAEIGELIKQLGDEQAEVFVRIGRDTRWADVRAAITRGIKGIVYPGADDADEVSEIAELITSLEKERGVEAGLTEIALILESAKGFWNAAAIAQASSRVCALGVGRIDLTMQLGPVPQNEFRLYRFLMTRALLAARMLDKQALGANWRPGSRGGLAPAQATLKAAREARLMGFTGCLCALADQVAHVNRSYSLG
jgi:citrate lyase beta subunit